MSLTCEVPLRNQEWLSTTVHDYNPALRNLKQEDYKFKASLGNTARPCLKK
jgi:hypothetical protein